MDWRIIVQKCIEGDEIAWEMLVRKYSNRIFNLAYQFCGIYQEAEDITQEIFLKLFKSLNQYDFRKNFEAWLITFAKNYCIDQYRKSKYEKSRRMNFNKLEFIKANNSTPEENFLLKEKLKLIFEGLENLPPGIRMAIILRDIHGMSYEEIAQIMNLPLGTVKSRINRGRIQLAKNLINKIKNEM
jgi:RNA polymerase sigma-70 factor (ECF subfamily)